jgi:hypothetical protein
MPATPLPEQDQSLDGFDPVIDLASRDTAGWEVPGRRDGASAADAIGVALMSRRQAFGGRFLGVRLSARAAKHAARRLDRAGRLDGLALILAGPIDRDGLGLLQRARERGALVGCDTTAALVHFAALKPDLLSLPAPRPEPARSDATAAGVVRVLVALADTIGARVLVHDVTSIRQAEALRQLGVALAQGDPFGRSPLRPADPPANLMFAPFGRAKRSWTVTLEELRPSHPATSSVAALVELCLDHVDHDWIVLVDQRSRPVHLIERAALLLGDAFQHQAVRVHPASSLRSVAQAALDRPEGERSQPLVVCDCAGRYRGLLMIERPSKALAA